MRRNIVEESDRSVPIDRVYMHHQALRAIKEYVVDNQAVAVPISQRSTRGGHAPTRLRQYVHTRREVRTVFCTFAEYLSRFGMSNVQSGLCNGLAMVLQTFYALGYQISYNTR